MPDSIPPILDTAENRRSVLIRLIQITGSSVEIPPIIDTATFRRMFLELLAQMSGDVTSDDITDATAAGRAILTAADANAQAALLSIAIQNLSFSGLPTSDPGGGKLWLNGGVLMVGAA